MTAAARRMYYAMLGGLRAIAAAIELTIVGFFPNGTVGVAYDTTLDIEDETPPTTVAVMEGVDRLPPGLDLEMSVDGLGVRLVGTPSTIKPVITGAWPVIPRAAAYSQRLPVTHMVNTGPDTPTAQYAAGFLPLGLTISYDAGTEEVEISGTTFQSGFFEFTILLTDSTGRSAEFDYRVEVRAGALPSAYANLTSWHSASDSRRWQDFFSNAVSYRDNEKTALVWNVTSIARLLFCNDVLWLRSFWPLGPCFNSLYGPSYPQPYAFFYARGTFDATTATPISTLVSVSNKVIIIGLQVDDCDTENVPSPDNMQVLFGERNNWFGLLVYRTGTTVTFRVYHWTASTRQQVEVTASIGDKCVITVKHSGGQLRIRKDGGGWTSVAHGNTGSLAGNCSGPESQSTSTPFDIKWNELVTYNAARTDAEIYEVEKFIAGRQGRGI